MINTIFRWLLKSRENVVLLTSTPSPDENTYYWFDGFGPDYNYCDGSCRIRMYKGIAYFIPKVDGKREWYECHLHSRGKLVMWTRYDMPMVSGLWQKIQPPVLFFKEGEEL